MITLRCVHDEGLDHKSCAGCGADLEHAPFVTSVNSVKTPNVCFGKVCLPCRDIYYANKKLYDDEKKRSEISNDF